MTDPVRALCLHGHYYQPPRQHPWLGVVEPDASAAPARDWNTRITAECYAPNAAARVLDAAGRLLDVVDLYRWTSFDFGPTLLAWLAARAPDVLAALRAADAVSRARTGYGNAWAQAYGHAILPLSTARDVRTQVHWGRREFEFRFGRAPEGMWLPEMAVDRQSLMALAEAGIGLTMLSPHQARRVRPLGAPDDAWQPVTAVTLDTRRLYRCMPAPGLAVDVCFRDAGLSHDLAFDGLLADGAGLARRLVRTLADTPPDAILCVAVDGETYGHHHRFGEMALAFAVRALAAQPELALAGPAAFRASHPPAFEVEIACGTSWSCVHGIERWRADCGCRVGTTHTSQAWRAPLRQAIDWLRDQLAGLYETRAGEVLRDPLAARDRYVECVLDPDRAPAFVAAEAQGTPSAAATLQARRSLELARHALLMQTSCGWFFDQLAGVEPALVLGHAGRALELAGALGGHFEAGFLEQLEPARSERPGGESGADLFRRTVRGLAATPARVAASAALLRVLGAADEVPGYDVRWPAAPPGGRLVADAQVTERATGAVVSVSVAAKHTPGTAPSCRVGEETFGAGDLFAGQQERLFAALGCEAAGTVRAARRATLANLRPLLAPLGESAAALPPVLAQLLGWELAETIVATVAAHGSLATLTAETVALRRRGVVLPAAWLAPRLTDALEARVAGLPHAAPGVLVLLDLAEVTGVPLDLERAQRQVLAWWRAAGPMTGTDPALVALRARLALAPEGAP